MSKSTSWRSPGWPVWLVATVALVGVSLFLLPAIAGWFSQMVYSNEVRGLHDTVQQIQPRARTVALDDARDYNRRLISAPVIIGANEHLPRAENAATSDDEYSSMLAADDDGLMARLKIPAIQVDLPVYHGTSDDTLKQGVGHLQGSALPVGGVNAHSVLTAHRGLSQAELFTNLDRVSVGDTFTLEVFGEVLTYLVVETSVVEPHETGSLFPRSGLDLVTLITCTPLGVNSHRILVTGERITPTPIEDVAGLGAEPEVPGFPWWTLHLGAATLVIGSYVAWSGRHRVAISQNTVGRPEFIVQ